MEAFEEVDSKYLNPLRPKPNVLHKLALLVRALGIVLTTCSITFYITIANYVFKPILGRAWYRKFADFCQQRWFDSMFFLLPRTKLHLSGDFPLLQQSNSKVTKIVIANHSTDVDWIYLWMLAQVSPQGAQCGHAKILLKEGIRTLPVIGGMMDKMDFIWVKRDWEKDQDYITNKLALLTSDEDSPLWIFIFPEGMTVNTKSMEKSHKFALEQNRSKLDFTLLPRSKGLECIVEGVTAKRGAECEIYDLTMSFAGYSGEVPTWEMGYERNLDFSIPNVQKLFFGLPVGECFIDVRRFAGNVQDGDKGLQAWLDERWVRKDLMLRDFATTKQWSEMVETFVPTGNVLVGSMVFALQSSLFLFACQRAYHTVLQA